MHALVLPDGPPEDDTFLRVGGHLFDEPIAVPYALGGDQRALRVQSVEDVAEALAFLADEALGRNFEIVEEQLAGLVIDHVADRRDRQPFTERLARIDEEHRKPVRFLAHRSQRRRSRQ